MDRETLADQRNDRSKMDFLRSDLTDAENFMNVSRVQPYQINQFSFSLLNKQAVREFKNSAASQKLMKLTR